LNRGRRLPEEFERRLKVKPVPRSFEGTKVPLKVGMLVRFHDQYGFLAPVQLCETESGSIPYRPEAYRARR
jgi:hypothetical protein